MLFLFLPMTFLIVDEGGNDFYDIKTRLFNQLLM